VNINVPAYSVPLNPTQPNGKQNIDDGDARFSAMVYQVGGVLYAVHSTQQGSHAAIRWYKINAADFTLLQSGTISDPNLDLFYPSIAANPSGVVVICYDGCSASSFVSIYTQFGETSADGSTTFGSPLLLKASSVSYTLIPSGDTTSRWGDYSSVCVDPVDPNRFWTINMYPSSANDWSTQVTELLTATAMPELTITASSGTVSVCWPDIAIPVTLESTVNLTTPNWTPVTQNISSSAGQKCAILPTTGGSQFFRLRF
jgi:hypothetical protein